MGNSHSKRGTRRCGLCYFELDKKALKLNAFDTADNELSNNLNLGVNQMMTLKALDMSINRGCHYCATFKEAILLNRYGHEEMAHLHAVIWTRKQLEVSRVMGRQHQMLLELFTTEPGLLSEHLPGILLAYPLGLS